MLILVLLSLAGPFCLKSARLLVAMVTGNFEQNKRLTAAMISKMLMYIDVHVPINF